MTVSYCRSGALRTLSTLLLALAATTTFLAGTGHAQVVFNEVRYKDSSGSTVNQVVELKNVGAVPANIGSWIFCHQFFYNSVLPAGFTIPAGGYALIHFNQSGTNTASEVYFASDELATVTDLALYATANFTSSSAIRAFIQFGGHPGSGREGVAEAAGLWSTGAFIPAVANGHSIELCSGSAASPTSFVEQSTPTLGLDNGCGVPVQGTTWTKLKSLFH